MWGEYQHNTIHMRAHSHLHTHCSPNEPDMELFVTGKRLVTRCFQGKEESERHRVFALPRSIFFHVVLRKSYFSLSLYEPLSTLSFFDVIIYSIYKMQLVGMMLNQYQGKRCLYTYSKRQTLCASCIGTPNWDGIEV